MAFAVRSLSPVSMTTRMPISCISATARLLSSRSTSATAMMPMNLPPWLKKIGIFPESASWQAVWRASRGTLHQPSMNSALPAAISFPSSTPASPPPGKVSNSETSPQLTPSALAFASTALASGCPLFFSSITAILSRRSGLTPFCGSRSVTSGVPEVRVPVLSSTTVFILPVCSSAVAVLNNMPLRAPVPLPVTMATGVASPRAQGQLTTSTATACESATPACSPASIHPAKVTSAIRITAGTNTADTLSASLAMGALVAEASLTIFIILEKVVSSPTLTALQRRKPETLRVAAETGEPVSLSTGRLSPVRADSLTALPPSSTVPSTGMLSPGRTTKMSPGLTCSTGTSVSLPFFTTTAVLGESFARALSASVVFPIERASSILPTEISTSIIAELSKYSPSI